MTELGLFISAFVSVFALGFQSLNVNQGRYALAFMTSFAIAGGQIFVMRYIPEATPGQIIATLAGGPLGITASMYVHKHYVRLRKPLLCVFGLHNYVGYRHPNFHGYRDAYGWRCKRCLTFKLSGEYPPRRMPTKPPPNINCGADRP